MLIMHSCVFYVIAYNVIHSMILIMINLVLLHVVDTLTNVLL